MKTALALFLLSLGLAGCSNWFLQHGESKHTARRAHAAASSAEKEKPALGKPAEVGVGGVLGSDDSGILVSAAWMKRYQEMEKKYGSVSADAQIWPEGYNFRINSDVSAHFSEMKIAENVRSAPTKKE